MLSLAESELYRARWSEEILDETLLALIDILIFLMTVIETRPTEKAIRHIEAIRKAILDGH